MTSTAFPQNLRYSPVNWLIVDWGFNGQAFSECGLPQPDPCPEPKPGQPEICCPLPVQEAINTYDWDLWLPEVIVGIEDPDEEIAAHYVRAAAIDFAKTARVLQRQIVIPLQQGTCTYSLEPYEGERIVGVIGAAVDDCQPCPCSNGCTVVMPNGLSFRLDPARNELTLESYAGDCTCASKLLRVLVWSAPTEQACAHDVFLYDNYRSEITAAARLNYAKAVHFRDRLLMQSLPSQGQIETAKATAKLRAGSSHSWNKMRPGSGMWSGCNTLGSISPRRGYMR